MKPTKAEQMIQNLHRLEELNREFLRHCASNNLSEAQRCVDEMKTIKLYEVEESQ